MVVLGFLRALSRLEREGVIVIITSAFTPESNELDERVHQTVLGNARAYLIEVKLSLKYWSYTLRQAVDCRNSAKINASVSVPHELLFGG